MKTEQRKQRLRMFVGGDYRDNLTVNGILAQQIGMNETLVFCFIEALVFEQGIELKDKHWVQISVRHLHEQFEGFWSMKTTANILNRLCGELRLLLRTNKFNNSPNKTAFYYTVNWKTVQNLHNIEVGYFQQLKYQTVQNLHRFDENCVKFTQFGKTSRDATRTRVNSSQKRDTKVSLNQEEATPLPKRQGEGREVPIGTINRHTLVKSKPSDTRDARSERVSGVGLSKKSTKLNPSPSSPLPLTERSEVHQVKFDAPVTRKRGDTKPKIISPSEIEPQGKLFGKSVGNSLNGGKNSASVKQGAKKRKRLGIAPSVFEQMFRLCYLATNRKQITLLTRGQTGAAAQVIRRLHKTGMDLNRLDDFQIWWSNNWRSSDKVSGQYQPPRPMQVQELWLMAMSEMDKVKVVPTEVKKQNQINSETLEQAMLNRARERNGL